MKPSKARPIKKSVLDLRFARTNTQNRKKESQWDVLKFVSLEKGMQ